MSEDTRTQPGSTLDAPAIALAQIGAVTDEGDEVREWVYVHFNPASLQLAISNELKDTSNQQRSQYVAKTSAKLTMDLQFDTTHTGEDVTEITRKMQGFLLPETPPGQSPPREPPPPVVLFQWATIKFKGIVESYRETIDYFAANGIPLRALVNLTLSRQDKVFDEAPEDAPSGAGDVNSDLTEAPAASASDLASRARVPGSARGLATLNAQESLRFGAGASFGVSASVNLNGPVGLGAGAGAGFGAGVGASLGAGAGVGFGAGAGLGIGAGAGFAASAGGTAGFGAGAGVGVSGGVSGGLSVGAALGGGAGVNLSGGAGISGRASLAAAEGAFAGLRTPTRTSGFAAKIDSGKLAARARSSSVSTDRGATFHAGGRAATSSSTGFRADVGAGGSMRGRLDFD
jgi:hypothetical protein